MQGHVHAASSRRLLSVDVASVLSALTCCMRMHPPMLAGMYDTEPAAASAWDQAALVMRAEGEREGLQLNIPHLAETYDMKVRPAVSTSWGGMQLSRCCCS